MVKKNFQLVTIFKHIDGHEYEVKASFKTLENAIARFNTYGCKTTKEARAFVRNKITGEIVWKEVKEF